jgi:branched-chain amino acid transport system substrate-binding protein
MTPRSVRTGAAVAAAAVLLVAGCGNRVPHDRVVAVGNGYGPVNAQQAEQSVDAAADATAAVPGAGQPAPGGAVAPGAPTAGTPAVPQAGSGGRPSAPGSQQQTPGQQPQAAGSAPCAQPLSPIVLGQTLASSGLVGAAIAGIRTGLAVWAKDVNTRGGVECHPVQLIQLDDASDPARVTANWNTIKARGAVAMVGAGVPIAIAALRSAAERDGIPVVGGDVTAVDWTQSPLLFPTGGAPLTAYDGATAEAAQVAMQKDGKVKAGLIYCVEASICTSIKSNFAKSVERSAGATLGPIQAASLTQPDFSSECQTMKAAGVNVLFYALDGSAIIRATRSCASLNYFPTTATGAIGVSAAASADQGVRRNGAFLGSGVAPYTAADLPSVQAFRDAMGRYAASSAVDQQTLLGWASGKLFEAALKNVSAKARAGDVTTAVILDGLAAVKNEKLAGLSPGATFTRGQPAKLIDCYYPLRLEDKGFSSPLGGKAACFNGNKIQVGTVADSGSPAASTRAPRGSPDVAQGASSGELRR